MANPSVMTALCQCTFGAAPCPLTVSSQKSVMIMNQLCATIMDNKPATFGMCSNPANPAVASATAAALGVLTPMPCTPVTPAPWAPGSMTVMVENKILLNNSSKLMCSYGGVISISMTPAMTVNVP